MMGSLRNPAGFCNIYGYRPSWGLVPNEIGGDLFVHTMATLGPMARDIEDLVLLLDVLAEPYSLSPFGQKHTGFATHHAPADLRGKRIARLGNWGGAYPCEAGILETCENGLSVLSDLGAEIVALDPPFSSEAIWEAWGYTSFAGDLRFQACFMGKAGNPKAHQTRDTLGNRKRRSVNT